MSHLKLPSSNELGVAVDHAREALGTLLRVFEEPSTPQAGAKALACSLIAVSQLIRATEAAIWDLLASESVPEPAA